MKKNIILLLFLAVGFLSASAQTKPSKKQPKKEKSTETDDYSAPKKEKSKTVKVYETDDYEAPKAQKKGFIEEYNLLKYNAFAIFNGCFPLSYERVLTPKWSLEGTIGLTSPDLKATRNRAFSPTATLKVENDMLWGDEYMESQIGYMFGLSARYYPFKGSHIPEGGYILGGFQQQTHKYVASAFTRPATRGGGAVQTTANLFDMVRLAFGYQGGSSFWYWDYYIGAALRQTSMNGSYYDNNNVYMGNYSFGTKVVLLSSIRFGVAF